MIILLGLPGAGKGTLAKILADVLDYEHVSTGDLLRQEVAKGTDLGKKVQERIDVGELVPDEIINNIVIDKLKENPKVILDGYPRNLEQAKLLTDLEKSNEIKIEAIVLLDIREETIFKRLRRRREIENRPDDTDEVIRKRIDIALKELTPVFSYYENDAEFHIINAEEEIDKNVEDVIDILMNF